MIKYISNDQTSQKKRFRKFGLAPKYANEKSKVVEQGAARLSEA